MLRASRNRVNSGRNWLFSPDVRAAAHVAHRTESLGAGALLLLASDGFLALASDYAAYDLTGLMAAAKSKGLAALGEELRAIEAADAGGEKFARFKKSDDATALLLIEIESILFRPESAHFEKLDIFILTSWSKDEDQ